MAPLTPGDVRLAGVQCFTKALVDRLSVSLQSDRVYRAALPKTLFGTGGTDRQGNGMTVAEKVEILQSIFRQTSNLDVLTWGPFPGGYRWTCANRAAARRLASLITSHLKLLQLDRSTFPFRFDLETGSMLIFEPIADPE